MITYERLLHRPHRPHRASSALWLLPLALALLAAVVAAGLDQPLPVEIPAAPPVVATAAVQAQPLEHARLRDHDRLAEPDPSPRAVAAYGD